MLSPDISLQDLETFVEISRLRSLKEAARQMDRRASSLSKVISAMERKLGLKLFVRSAKGMEMTPEGASLYQTARKMMAMVSEMETGHQTPATKLKKRKICTVGSISFLCTRMVAPSLEAVTAEITDRRFRIVEFSHNQLALYAARGALDVAVHIGPMEFTKAWHTVEIAKVRWGLYGRYRHPLGTRCSRAQVLNYPFIIPTGWNEVEGFVEGTDNCPEPLSNRIHGHEVATAETAIEVIRACDELAFIPEIAGRALTQSRQIQEIHIDGWPTVKRSIFMSVRSDQVSKRLFDVLRAAFKTQLTSETFSKV